MRLVLDTNTVISALLWKGVPHELLAAARETRAHGVSALLVARKSFRDSLNYKSSGVQMPYLCVLCDEILSDIYGLLVGHASRCTIWCVSL
jgi:hypothetical protein